MTILLSLIAIVIIAGLLYLVSLDGDYTVEKKHLIDADIQTVFDALDDFRSWPSWSPWIMHEPDCPLEYGEENGQPWYSWNGNIIGSGRMQRTLTNSPSRLENDLAFFKPFKSEATTHFDLKEIDGKTEVTWTMHSRMPFLMRFMIPMMKKLIGSDYSLGLAMLAGKLNPNSEYPQITFVGETELEATDYLCKEFSGGVEAMAETMKTEYPKLIEHIQQTDEDNLKQSFAVYHKANIKTMHFECDIAVSTNKTVESGTYKTKHLPAKKYFQVDVLGNYEFLELAWFSAMGHLKMRKIKIDNKAPSLEVYVNDPNSVEYTNEIKTSLYIPLKS